MNTDIRLKIFSFFVLLILTLSMLFPSTALADDTTPPPPETQETVPSTEETEEPVPVAEVTQEPPPTSEETQEPIPTAEVTQEPDSLSDGTQEPESTQETSTLEVVPTEGSTADNPPELQVYPIESPVVNNTPELQVFPTTSSDAPELQEFPVDEVSEKDTETEAPTENADTETVSLAEVISDAADLDVTLADGTGEPLALGTVEATEVLVEGDPYFVRNGTTYYFMPVGGCGLLLNCTESSTPIQAALDDVAANGSPDQITTPDGTLRQTIHVEPGVYEEQLVLADLPNLAGLTLWGDPGDLTLAGAGPNAPVLDGSNFAGSSTGITINAYGFSLIGFVIQNYDVGIVHNVLSGNTPSYILNNDIRNNGVGIQMEGGQGKPGPEVHYNDFDNNGYAIQNTNDNNVQYVEAQNNYWGCPQGPIVRYEKFQGKTSQGIFYRVWASPNKGGPNDDGEYPTNPYPDCAVLDGYNDLWNHQINTDDYSPFKINIDPRATAPEPVCGDGNLDPGEECDGSAPDHYTCTSECTLVYIPYCGDNIVNQASEECDGTAGVGANQYCSANCTLVDLPYCGDGTVNQASEECDDGNNANGDGCSATCTVEAPAPYCGDGTVNQASEECDDGNNANGDGCSATCTIETPAPYCGDGTVNQASEQCDDGNNLDGDGCSATCTIEAPAPYCGDGNLDPGEACDDGNTINGDGCSATCTIEAPAPYCGDGTVNQASEQCDDGNNVNDDGCSATCTIEAPAPYCGDGTVNQASEQCDDGNNVNDDGCSATCIIETPAPYCGDGTVNQASEQCDDGNNVNGDGCSATCTIETPAPYCGDGNLDLGEACDDGNNINGDGCSATCVIETTAPYCGDGNLDPGEECDDGNLRVNDGCSAICTIEVPVCGNGFVEQGEACDDGNNVNNDACTNACTLPNVPPPPTATPRPSTVLGGFIPVTGGETHAIAAGIAHTCALTPEGGVQCWGNNDYGQLGDGTYTGSNIRVDVAGLLGGTTIVAGGNHTCILSSGDVWCWGQNTKGQIGDGTTINRNVPVKVLSSAANITAGFDYTCATMLSGQVMCWGNNDKGQLGDGGQTNRTIPTLATLISSVTNVDAGQNETCGLTETGLVRCLSNGSSKDVDNLPETNLDVAVNRFGPKIIALNNQGVPVEFLSGKAQLVSQLSSILDVDSGLGHICALKETGGVYCWGSNYYGQLGNNSTTRSSDPVPVTNLSNAWQLAVGEYHACVLVTTSNHSDSGIRCWGLNTDGQLGDGTYKTSLVPVEVK
jgi:cysteine-rich repeat protein